MISHYTTLFHSLPLLVPAQTLKYITHNEAIFEIGCRLHLIVFSLYTASGEFRRGERFAIARSATRDWADQDDNIAQWQYGQWVFATPKPGWRASE